jgi:hypothetical protein
MKGEASQTIAGRFSACFENAAVLGRLLQRKFYFKRALLVVALALLPLCAAKGQIINSWRLSFSGKWEGTNGWSLGLSPDSTQSIYITNAGSDLVISSLPGKQVIIDATTSSNPTNMTVTNLTVYGAGSNVVNWLTLTNAGTNLPLHILNKASLAAGGQLTVDGSSLQVDGQFAVGEQTPAGFTASFPALLAVNSGSAQVGILAIGPASNVVGTLNLSGGTLLATNLGIGNNGATNLGTGTGTATVASGATLSVSSLSLGSTVGGVGSLLISDGATLAVGSNLTLVSSSLTATSSVTILGGSFLATNGLIQVGPNGSGVFTISGGTNIIRRLKLGGTGTNSSGHFAMSGGSLKVLGNGSGPGDGIDVNSSQFCGGDVDGTGTSVTIGDGHDAEADMCDGFGIFGAMYVGVSDHYTGTYKQTGGTMVISSSFIVGSDCPAGLAGAIGNVTLSAGQLIVTNATHTAVLDVRNGTFTVESGALLVVDNLVVTNSCGLFTNNGGIILPGNAFYTANLLLNPGAEDGALPNGSPPTLWTQNGNPAYVATFDPHTGGRDFLGGGAFGYLSQTVDLGGIQGFRFDKLDAGQLLATVSFWEMTMPNSAGALYDDAQVTVDFLDPASSVINSISTPEIEFNDWTNYTGQYVIPAGTRLIQYTMSFIPHSYSDQVYMDDNLLFVSSAESPPLRVRQAVPKIVLSWPAWAGNFVLQSTTDLTISSSWQTVMDVPVVDASGQFFVTNSILGPRRYYRLRGK